MKVVILAGGLGTRIRPWSVRKLCARTNPCDLLV